MALLFLCALAVRIIIPTGFMPAQGDGSLIIGICTGQGVVQAAIPIDRETDPADHQSGKSSECIFAAGLGGGALAATLSTVVAPTLLAARPPDRALAELTVDRLAAPPPPSQGPPASI